MGNIQNIYDTNIKSILGGNLDYFRNFRQDIIKNFIFDNKLIQNKIIFETKKFKAITVDDLNDLTAEKVYLEIKDKLELIN